MTLRELKKLVTGTKSYDYYMTPKRLMELKLHPVVSIEQKDGTVIMVFPNGYVLYVEGKYGTVFTLCSCDGDYCNYGKEHILKADIFLDMDWNIRLFLEGQDRHTAQIRNTELRRTLSYDAALNQRDTSRLADESLDPQESIILKEYVESLLSVLSPREREALHLYFYEQLTQEEVAEEMSVKRGSVSTFIRRGIQNIRDTEGIQETGIVRTKHHRK